MKPEDNRKKGDLLFLQVTSFLGGAEKSGLELAAALERRGLDVIFAVGQGGAVVSMAEDVLGRVVPMPFSPLVRPRLNNMLGKGMVGRLADAAGAIRRIRTLSSGVRLIYANGDHALLYAALSGTGKPFIYHARDVRLKGRFLSLAAGRAAAVVAASRFVAAHLTESGVPEEKVSVVHNGIDMDFYSDVPDRKAAREALGLPQDAPVVVWIGNFIAWKRPRTFIEAASRMMGEAAFVMVGGTYYPLDRTYEKMVVGEAKRQRVQVFPFTKDPRPFYAAADVFVSTSIREPFGRVLVEAMAAGRPVVSTSQGGKVEILDDGVDGLLVPADNPGALAGALKRLLADDALRKRMGDKGRKKALERFDMTRCAAEVAQVIDKVSV